MKLLVPLRMPHSDVIWLADKHWLIFAMIGIPPATDASKAIDRPSDRAVSNNSPPCSASSALLAVTTSLPLRSSSSTMVRAGSRPPISSATTLISGFFVIRVRSSVNTPAGRSTARVLEDVAIHDRLQPEGPASMPGRAVTVVEQQSRNAGADVPHSHNRDLRLFHILTARTRTTDAWPEIALQRQPKTDMVTPPKSAGKAEQSESASHFPGAVHAVCRPGIAGHLEGYCAGQNAPSSGRQPRRVRFRHDP